MAHFIPCVSTDSSADFAKIFVDTVRRLHGLPDDRVSDRGTLSSSNFFQDVCKDLGITPLIVTTAHQQADGQTERTNRTLEQYLRSYVNYQQDDWIYLLPLAEFAYNNAVNASTGMTPFRANYGFDPRCEVTFRKAEVTSSDPLIRFSRICRTPIRTVKQPCKKHRQRTSATNTRIDLQLRPSS
jgi:hypothetical protein